MRRPPFLRSIRTRLRSIRTQQRSFAFIERSARRERWFKRSILLTTFLVIVAILRIFPWGRYLEASVETKTTGLARRAFGMTSSRAEIIREWANYRQLGIERARPQIEEFYDKADPAFQKLLRYAGMDPEHGLIRWGNYNWTLLLSSKVFEADDEGRSYRLRPNVRSIWLQQLNYLAGPIAFYLVPDGPGLAEAMEGTSAIAVPTSRQTTNSWGLRGPEPDLDAPLRILVLGDSYMEGMFIGDDETPPECLRRYLSKAMGQRVSVLNTGVMGYSPEQYHAALRAFADRYRPHCVIVSIFANDGGSEFDAVSAGQGDWLEAEYWLNEILNDCKARGWLCMMVPAPFEYSMLERRHPGNYPGRLANMLNIESHRYFDPIESFLNADLETRLERLHKGERPGKCALFNGAIKDGHFSVKGAEVWAESVGRRLLLMMEEEQLLREVKRTGKSVASSKADRGEGISRQPRRP